MPTLKALRAALARTRGERERQQELVKEIEAPIRKLRELETEEAAAAAAAKAVEAEVTRLDVLIAGADEVLDFWEPRMEKLQTAHTVLVDLEEAIGRRVATNYDNFTVYQAARIGATIFSQIEQVETVRQNRAQWVAEKQQLVG